MLKSLYRLLSSIRLTVVLFLLLCLIFLLGLWIPQKSLLKNDLYLQWKTRSPDLVTVLEAIGFTEIYTSPVTIFIWTLFFLNLSLVLVKRLGVVRSLTTLKMPPLEALINSPYYIQRAEIGLNRPDRAGLFAFFKKSGYEVIEDEERFYAVKNRLSPYANLLFHLSFYILLIGGVISVYTKFTGLVNIAEGEEFYGELERYNAPPRLPKIGSPPELGLSVEKVEPELTAGLLTGIKVTIKDADGTIKTAEVNRPYKKGSVSMVIRQIGITPLFIIFDRAGNEIDGAYVKLDVLGGKEDRFNMAGINFYVRFYPDYAERDGEAYTRSQELKNPVFVIYARKGQDIKEKIRLTVGEKERIGDYVVSIQELRYWVQFYVVKEHGVGIVYAGFGIAIVALLWRLLFYRREFAGIIRKEDDRVVINISGRAEFYRVLFEDEFKAFVDALREELS